MRIEPGDANLVVLRRRNQPCHKRPVTVPVPGAVAAPPEIPAHNVIHVTIIIIVDTIVGYLVLITPDPFPVYVPVIPVQPRIYHRNDYGLRLLAKPSPRGLAVLGKTHSFYGPLIVVFLSPGILWTKNRDRSALPPQTEASSAITGLPAAVAYKLALTKS